MTTTFQIPAQPVATKFLAAETMVRIRHNVGLFRVLTPAAWADSGHTIPTHYDVTGPNGRLHRMVPVERITVYSRALPLAFATYMADPDVRIDPVDRMMAKPAATMAMARRLLSPRFVETHSLLEIAAVLAPRYFETHCHRCAGEINNLEHPSCPACEGIKCKCGGCRCNWPYASGSVRPVTGPRIQSSIFGHRSLSR
jgi:hypothetical protein